MEEQPVFSEPVSEPVSQFKYFPFFSGKQPVFLLLVLGIIFYCTSLYNEYALDDGIIIHQNEYVIKGFNGIPDLFTKDSYHSFYKRMCAADQLYGGRYRPLAAVSYAIEQQFIGSYPSGKYYIAEDLNQNGRLDDSLVSYTNHCGNRELGYEYNNYVDVNNDGKAQPNECYSCWDRNKNFTNDFEEDTNKDGVYNEVDCQTYGASLRHFDNIWMYVLACLLLYFLLRDYIFKKNPDIAFLSALIFLMHPVHSEAVANVKGREDLLSFIFIISTLIFALKYYETKKITSVIFGSLCFLLALLSKEYGLLLIVLLPLTLYIFNKSEVTLANHLALFMPLTFILLTYLGFHFFFIPHGLAVPDTEILNNPFHFATGEQKFASEIHSLLLYLKITIFPHPLVSDYSYDSIPYRDFSSWDFWLSLLINLSLIATAFVLVIKKDIVGYALMVYYLFLIFTSNLFFPTATRVMEIYLFHASMGFSILLGWAIITFFEKKEQMSMSSKRNILFIAGTIIIILCCAKTWERNWDWKNDVTLFLKDVKNAPNSVLVLGNAGARWIDLADTREITGIKIPGQDPKLFNDYNGTLFISNEDLKESGYKDKREVALHRGIDYLEKAVKLHPRYVNGYLNLGLAYFKLNNDTNAIINWKLAERLYPNNPYLMNYYNVYSRLLQEKGARAFEEKDYKKAVYYYNLATIVYPENYEAWYNLSGTYYNAGEMNKAKTRIDEAEKLKGDDPEIEKLQELIYQELNLKKD